MSRIALVVHAVVPGDPRVRRQTDALIGAGHEVDVFSLRGPREASDRVSVEPGLRIIRP